MTSHTLCTTSHSDNVWHLLHYTKHHIRALWHQATIFMTSHPLYLTSYPLYLCHHTHFIDDITPTEFLRYPLLYMTTTYTLHMTSQPLNVCHHTHSFNDITPFVCRTCHPVYIKYNIHSINHYVHILWHHTTLFITSQSLYSWHLPHYIWNGIQQLCVITTSVLMVSLQLYVWHYTTLRMPSYALYTTSHPLFMTSHHCSYHITSTEFMTLHTLYMMSHTWQ